MYMVIDLTIEAETGSNGTDLSVRLELTEAQKRKDLLLEAYCNHRREHGC